MSAGFLLFGVTGIPVVVALVWFWLWSAKLQNVKEQDQYRVSKYKERYHNTSEPHVRVLASRIETIGDELRAQRQQHHHHENRRALLERVGVVAAIIAAWLAGVSAWVFQSQLDEARDEQRPWVYADVVPAGHIIFANGMYSLPLKFSITNTGHLPAFFVIPKTSAVIFTTGPSAKAIRNEICDAYGSDDIKAGDTVFPGQTITHGGFTSDDYPSVTKESWDAISTNRVFIVYGCVDYQFPEKPGHHQSRFAFVAGKATDQGILARVGFLPDDPTTVDIRLMRTTIGNDEIPAN